MKCPKCNTDNPDSNKFCRKCATPLTKIPGTLTSPPIEEEVHEKSALDFAPGQYFGKRYQIIEAIGRGGMGRVYKASDKELNRTVSLKMIKPELSSRPKIIERFKKEIKLASQITHENVCRIHDLGEVEGIRYISMQFIEGQNLHELIQTAKKLNVDTAINITEQICQALTASHKKGIIHRDLKPQNIMIDKKGNAYVMDFGIARSLEAEEVTKPGLVIGTPHYMSPEQAEGEAVDIRSDIYSLGCILYEMLTGRPPFEANTSVALIHKHLKELPKPPSHLNPQVSPFLEKVILKCMEKDPRKRYKGAEELLSTLRDIEKGIPVISPIKQPQMPAFLMEVQEEVEGEKPVFVAREQEIKKLNKFLEMALNGQGRVVFATGEAGSGKTALMQEFAQRIQEVHADLIVANGKCNAHTGIGDPYLPFIEILSLLTGDVEVKWRAGIISREHATRLWNLIPLSAEILVNNGPDLIDIFVTGMPLASRAQAFATGGETWLSSLKKLVEYKAAVPADSTLQQSNLFAQYTRVLQALAQREPLLLVLDDLQWVDAGSASLLFHLGRRLEGSRILIIGAFRPAEVALGRSGERHPLESVFNELKRDFGDIELEVGKAEARQFIDSFLDTEPNRLGAEFRDTLYRHTNGHPLFTIELLRGMQEQGLLVKDRKGRWIEGPELNWVDLPARVDAVIEERINRLTERLREILSLASVEGEEFTAEVLARLQKTELRNLIRMLSSELDRRHHLVSAKGIKRIDGHRLSLYLFQHILFQRYLYNSLDEVERAHLHEEVGNVLEMLYGKRADEISVQLARHFQEAGMTPKAVKYLHKAGEKAIRMSANEEAIAHIGKAIELLDTMPDNPERAQQELNLQLSLHAPLQATRGLGAPELGQALSRAQELCQQIGDTSQLFQALSQLATFYSMKGEYRTTLELGKQITNIAKHSEDPMLIAISHFVKMWPSLNFGDITGARNSAEQAINLYNFEQHRFIAFSYGYDLGVISLAFGAWALWFLGYLDKALKWCKESIDLARKTKHPHSLAFALVGGFEFHMFLRELQPLKEYNEELLPLSTEQGFVYWVAHSIFYQGWMQTLEGKIKEGIKQMHQGIRDMRATGTETCLTRLFARMAEACKQVGETKEGLNALAEAWEVMDNLDERYMEAELYRLKGELLLMEGQAEAEGEGHFHQAIEIARQQQAKILELRAVMSLSRLLQKQGKKAEARKLLQEIYGWFTEGFGMADLKEAKVLLKELS